MVGRGEVLPHPLEDVATAGEFPFVDMSHMPEVVELVPNPGGPFAIDRRAADKNLGHLRSLSYIRRLSPPTAA